MEIEEAKKNKLQKIIFRELEKVLDNSNQIGKIETIKTNI
jgi:hypothetical protein